MFKHVLKFGVFFSLSVLYKKALIKKTRVYNYLRVLGGAHPGGDYSLYSDNWDDRRIF